MTCLEPRGSSVVECKGLAIRLIENYEVLKCMKSDP